MKGVGDRSHAVYIYRYVCTDLHAVTYLNLYEFVCISICIYVYVDMCIRMYVSQQYITPTPTHPTSHLTLLSHTPTFSYPLTLPPSHTTLYYHFSHLFVYLRTPSNMAQHTPHTNLSPIQMLCSYLHIHTHLSNMTQHPPSHSSLTYTDVRSNGHTGSPAWIQ